NFQYVSKNVRQLSWSSEFRNRLIKLRRVGMNRSHATLSARSICVCYRMTEPLSFKNFQKFRTWFQTCLADHLSRLNLVSYPSRRYGEKLTFRENCTLEFWRAHGAA